MALFEKTVECPVCHRREAKKALFGKVRCPNPECPNHDPRLRAKAPVAARRAEEAFRPGTGRLVVRYRNFRGEEKRFEADPRSVRVRRSHVSLRVAPTGRRIALKKDAIHDLEEVLAAAAKVPPPFERKILTYHLRRGTTSPRFEEVRRRHPDWAP